MAPGQGRLEAGHGERGTPPTADLGGAGRQRGGGVRAGPAHVQGDETGSLPRGRDHLPNAPLRGQVMDWWHFGSAALGAFCGYMAAWGVRAWHDRERSRRWVIGDEEFQRWAIQKSQQQTDR